MMKKEQKVNLFSYIIKSFSCQIDAHHLFAYLGMSYGSYLLGIPNLAMLSFPQPSPN